MRDLTVFECKHVNVGDYNFTRSIRREWPGSVRPPPHEVIPLHPRRITQNGLCKAIYKGGARSSATEVESLDFDAELKSSRVGSATNLPFDDRAFDLTCTFQILEHFRYDIPLQVFEKMVRTGRKHIVISLPDAKPALAYDIYLPKLGHFACLFEKAARSPEEV